MHTLRIVFVAALLPAAVTGSERAAPLEKAWYTPHRLLSLLARRDGIRWAMPETLAGRALVGGDAISTTAALTVACKQWGLSWQEVNGVVVVHRADDAGLKKWSAALAG